MDVDEAESKRINSALQNWRQGDCVIDEHWFLFRFDVTTPLTVEAVQAAQEGHDTDAAEAQVRGLMLTSQTCDIVRDCSDRPYIEVSPLVEVDTDKLEEIRKGRRPNYAYVPGLTDDGDALVADLDRTMTVEKAVVANWKRSEGCRDDNDARRLALALARKRARFAFPDDFVEFVKPLQNRLISKHSKNSDEGHALRALREIRVRAAPAWDAAKVEITFWFIRRKHQSTFADKTWDHYLQAWLDLVPASGRFKSVEGLVHTLDDLTARDYIESDPLDLDHLSE